MTDTFAKESAAGWVCYDDECALCRRWRRRIEAPLSRQGFQFVPLQTAWVKARLNLADGEPIREMRVLLPRQQVLDGADAAVVLMHHVWWLAPLWVLSRIPGTMPIFRAIYRHIAAHRHCSGGACSLESIHRAPIQPFSTNELRPKRRTHRASTLFEMP